MTTPPFASVQASINSGANQSGGITADHGDTVDLSAASTIGHQVHRWEIYEYPDGYTVPAGWTEDTATKIYFFSDGTTTPPQIELPLSSSLWGKYMFRLIVNNGDGQGAVPNAQLTDEATAITILSPNGLRDMAFQEDNQFADGDKLARDWVQDHKKNLRVIEADLGGGGGGLTAPVDPGDDERIAYASSGDLAYAPSVRTDGTALKLGASGNPVAATGIVRVGRGPSSTSTSIFSEGLTPRISASFVERRRPSTGGVTTR